MMVLMPDVDDPRREMSIGTIWDNSIDWDDAEDGSDGGYDRHGNFINVSAMAEIVRLRLACTLSLNLLDGRHPISDADRRETARRVRGLLDIGRKDGGGR